MAATMKPNNNKSLKIKLGLVVILIVLIALLFSLSNIGVGNNNQIPNNNQALSNENFFSNIQGAYQPGSTQYQKDDSSNNSDYVVWDADDRVFLLKALHGNEGYSAYRLDWTDKKQGLDSIDLKEEFKQVTGTDVDYFSCRNYLTGEICYGSGVNSDGSLETYTAYASNYAQYLTQYHGVDIEKGQVRIFRYCKVAANNFDDDENIISVCTPTPRFVAKSEFCSEVVVEEGTDCWDAIAFLEEKYTSDTLSIGIINGKWVVNLIDSNKQIRKVTLDAQTLQELSVELEG